ncbi:MAG TPA: hypothetical protein VII08_08870 [Myxococcales bacterium]
MGQQLRKAQAVLAHLSRVMTMGELSASIGEADAPGSHDVAARRVAAAEVARPGAAVAQSHPRPRAPHIRARDQAQEVGGANPAAAVERRKVPKRLPNYLRLDEVPRLLSALDPKWRSLFATSIAMLIPNADDQFQTTGSVSDR